MLVFDTQVQREQYGISGEEVFMAERGALLAYERSTRSYYRPKFAGQGASRWERVSGPMHPRAAGDTLPERRGERYNADLTVLTGDDHVVIDDLILDASATINGEMSFVRAQGAYTKPGSTDLYGEQTDDGGRTVDGEEIHMHTRSEMMRCLLRQEIGHGHVVTVPHGYSEILSSGVVLNGQLTVNGQVA